MYNEKKIKKSELLQLILLDNLYAQSGSDRIIFQGGTALRWVYGGMRFSEDLDFVTDLPREDVENILAGTFQKTQMACIAQFGPGESEHKPKSGRKQAIKTFFIYRPETQRERIAVKLEFEFLAPGRKPRFQKFVLRDLPSVAGLVTSGKLIIPYSSSIILTETPEEILSDKIRALYERRYLKGRDIYDIWWIKKQLKATPTWIKVREKLVMYQAPFVPARGAFYFQQRESTSSIIEALKRDLPRFLPQNIIAMYQEANFSDFITTLREVISDLLNQGMTEYFNLK
ncbi:MAG: nucleotidyl transferase AbiEii/AbiGii toxin family protein [Desulfobacterales bacterium]|nr:nucleotidyl transferase AbiEii/AbiGii toxin family protein [Desulfobacterales bacterium]